MNDSRRALSTTVASLLVAGICLAPQAIAAPSGRGEHAPVSVALEAEPASMRGCIDNHNIRMIPFEHANSFLPDGFKSADASVILFAWSPVGVPIPQGKAVAVSPGMICDWSDWEGGPIDINWIVIPIERPSVRGVSLDPDRIDLYLVTYLTSGSRTLQRFRQLGFGAVEATTISRFSAGTTSDIRPSAIGHSRTGVGARRVVEFDVAGGAAVRSGFRVRIWLQTQRGLGFFEWDRSVSTVIVGGISGCKVAARSTHAKVFRTTDCSSAAVGGEDSVGATFSESTDFIGTFTFLRGRTVRERRPSDESLSGDST